MEKYLHLSFDVGHSSIGWCVLENEQKNKKSALDTLHIKGTGAVIFQADDVQTQERRIFRATRRRIRSTRRRIKSLALLWDP